MEKAVHDCLKDDGLFLLHTIGSNITTTLTDPGSTNTFSNSLIPSIRQIGEAHRWFVRDGALRKISAWTH